MILSGKGIIDEMESNYIHIEPFFKEFVNPNSYDVHLSEYVSIIESEVLDVKKDYKIRFDRITSSGYKLLPNECYLLSTIEKIGANEKYVPFLDGKSSVGRFFISVHETAGKGDIGFVGHWTLEVTVKKPTIVYPGMPIGQVYFFLASAYDKVYQGNYINQSVMPVKSKLYKSWPNKYLIQDYSSGNLEGWRIMENEDDKPRHNLL